MPVALISGISGQDGSYLAESLLADGYQVHGIARSANPDDIGNLRDGERLEIHHLDLATGDGLEELVSVVQPDEVYSLAAVSSVARSWQEPVLTGAINGQAVVRLLNAAHAVQEASGKRVSFVQASSAEIFGEAEHSPQNEETRIRPTSPYGAAKAYAHHAVGVYRLRGLIASNCILYNHESPRRGEAFVTRKITSGVARISRGLQDSLELGNLDARRDFGWAPDYVRAMRLAAGADNGDDYVIATGRSHTISEFLDAAFDRVGISDWSSYVSVNPAFIRPADPSELRGDASKAHRLLGWSPTVDFDEIVTRMVDNDLALLD